MDDLISVIIPVYNTEKYLRRCLASVLNNTYRNIEVICVDDGSTDGSAEILNEIAQSDTRVKVIHQENSGVSAARNHGMKFAGGGYITFIDSDDWVHRDYFQALLGAIGDSEIAHCGHIRYSEMEYEDASQEIQSHVIPAQEGYQVFDVKCCAWGKLYRSELIKGLYFDPEIKILEDLVFTLQAIKRAHNITVVTNSLYYYFYNPTSASHTCGQNVFPAARKLLQLATETHDAVFLHNAYTNIMAHRYINMFEPDYTQVKQVCNQELKKCKELAKELLPQKRRTLLAIMVDFPILYRAWRIAGDRTLLDYEKNKKEERRKRVKDQYDP
jgi:glycosyltransferase involved in cell wall biosynthesis